MEDGPIRAGRIFVNVAQPRRAWRVTAQLGDNVRIERVDQPNVVRFPLRKVLLDLHRYVPDE